MAKSSNYLSNLFLDQESRMIFHHEKEVSLVKSKENNDNIQSENLKGMTNLVGLMIFSKI
jgi:hypothetical protein